MDYDNDGILDLISGSYDPGDLYLFRGQGNGKYAAVEQIVDQAGLALVHHPKEFAEWNNLEKEIQNSGEMDSVMLRVASFGSWPATVDWDADGDLDMLIGSFSGDLFLRTNVGTREKPEYDATAIPVQADGEPLHVNLHAAPVVADWNEDGTWDLVVGSGDGAVGWFENTGTNGKPKFGPYNELVSPGADSKFFVQNLNEGESPKLGVRAQICVTDYDLDGRLDLIVGDYSDVNWLRDMSAEEKKEQAEVQAVIDSLMQESAKVQKKYAAQYEAGEYDDEKYQAEMKKFSERYSEIETQSKAFIKESRRASFVWLFRRRDENSSERATDANTKKVSADQVPEKAVPAKVDAETEKPDRFSTDQLSLVTTAEPVSGSDDTFRITVAVLIHPGWHLYSDVPAGGAHRAATLALDLPKGVQSVGDWDRPKGVPSREGPQEKIYTGLVQFTHTVKTTDSTKAHRVRVILDYEVCKQQFCLPPSKLRQTIELTGP